MVLCQSEIFGCKDKDLRLYRMLGLQGFDIQPRDGIAFLIV